MCPTRHILGALMRFENHFTVSRCVDKFYLPQSFSSFSPASPLNIFNHPALTVPSTYFPDLLISSIKFRLEEKDSTAGKIYFQGFDSTAVILWLTSDRISETLLQLQNCVFEGSRITWVCQVWQHVFNVRTLQCLTHE